MSQSSSTTCPPSCSTDSRCYIIPPYLLEAISNADNVSSEIRDAARKTVNQTTTALRRRQDHTARLRADRLPPNASSLQTSSTTASNNQPGRSSIIPDHLLQNILQSEGTDTQSRKSAAHTLEVNKQVRAKRAGDRDESVTEHLWREVYDSGHVQTIPCFRES